MAGQQQGPSTLTMWLGVLFCLAGFWILVCWAFPGARELFAALWGFFRTVANF